MLWTMLLTPLDAGDVVDEVVPLMAKLLKKKHKGNVVAGLYTRFVTVRLMLLQQLVVDVVTTMFRRLERSKLLSLRRESPICSGWDNV